MSWKKAESLRGQLLRWLAIPLLLVLLINAWFSYRSAVQTADLAFDRLLMGSAEAIAEDIEFKNGELLVDLPYAALELLESNINERIFYRVIGPDGRTVTGYEDLPLPPASAETVVIGDSEAMLYGERYLGDAVHLIALKKKLYGADIANPVLIVVAATGDARDALSQQILLHGLLRQVSLIAAAGLLVWLGLGRGLRSLMRLRNEVAERSVTDLTPIAKQDVPVEVHPLIDAMNQHSTRIERMLTNRTRFIADATHQIRTPLAEMRTQIDYSLRQNEPALAVASLRELQGDVDRLSHLVTQLLMQARADPDGVREHSREPVDLGELAHQTALEKVSAARRKSIDLSYVAPARPVVLHGDALLLRELIVNLVDNAISYTQAGGAVSVRVQSSSPVALEVQDDGPGIAFDEREQVFERFYRGRAQAGLVQTGSGLGLSIVRDIASSHNAHVELDTPESGRGRRVRVIWDVAAQPM